MLTRCGTKNIWHWAHKGRLHCDPWWENETEWHRSWKSRFPRDWQEVPARDDTGELHIADVKTPYGLVVEFQHSAIKAEEVLKRTAFYGQVIWIVDGRRRPTDWIQYERMLSENRPQRSTALISIQSFTKKPASSQNGVHSARLSALILGAKTCACLQLPRVRRGISSIIPRQNFPRRYPRGNPCQLFSSGSQPSPDIGHVGDFRDRYHLLKRILCRRG